MQLSFHGAASCVTGSCHLLDVDGFRILIDCGLFQGEDELFSSNLKPFGFEPSSISAVILTHAHLDHCGRLPTLVRQGFRGPVYATSPTRYLAEIVLWDAAHLQEERFQGKREGRNLLPVPRPAIPLTGSRTSSTRWAILVRLRNMRFRSILLPGLMRRSITPGISLDRRPSRSLFPVPGERHGFCFPETSGRDILLFCRRLPLRRIRIMSLWKRPTGTGFTALLKSRRKSFWAS